MKTYTTRVTVPADRRITVELPEDIPEGEVEVTVCSGDGDEDDGRQFSGTGAELLEWLRRERELYPLSRPPRSRDEIDEEIRQLRDEWDR